MRVPDAALLARHHSASTLVSIACARTPGNSDLGWNAFLLHAATLSAQSLMDNGGRAAFAITRGVMTTADIVTEMVCD